MDDETAMDLDLYDLPSKLAGTICHQCGARTHPYLVDHGHAQSFKNFLEDVNSALNRSIGSRRCSYSSVRVLFLRWEIDTLKIDGENEGVQGEIDVLGAVFRDIYGFETETWSIPHHNAHRLLQRKISHFEEDHSDPAVLLIVHYGGHGALEEYNRSVWTEGSNPPGAVVEWFSIQPLLENCASDVVMLLDCCYAMSANKPSISGGIEVLSACGREHPTIEPGDWSFSQTLGRVLEQFSDRSFTVAQLHARLVDLCTPSEHKKLLNTPVHYANHTTKCSVRIASMTASSAPSLYTDADSSSQSSSPDSRLIEPRVLISVSVDTTAKEDPQAWLDWLLSHMPVYIANVRLEGLFGSHSTLGLFSLPVSVWDFLPNDPAYQFIQFVSTPNMLLHPADVAGHEKSKHSSPFNRSWPKTLQPPLQRYPHHPRKTRSIVYDTLDEEGSTSVLEASRYTMSIVHGSHTLPLDLHSSLDPENLTLGEDWHALGRATPMSPQYSEQSELEPLENKSGPRRDDSPSLTKQPINLFALSRVFVKLWIEPTNDPDAGTRPTEVDASAAQHMRFMIFASSQRHHRLCIPLLALNGQGPANSRSGPKSPTGVSFGGDSSAALSNEPSRSEKPIRIGSTPSELGLALPRLMRESYSSTYIVEHNVNMAEVGMVTPESVPRLIEAWRETLRDWH